jgi:TRAP-type mannitol/chloroaromatic compound transport system substrate-binding protein
MDPYPSDAIVPGTKVFDGLDSGLISYGETDIAYEKDKFPAAGLFAFQVAGLTAAESYHWFFAGGGRDLFNEMIKDFNVRALTIHSVTPECFLGSTKPIRSVKDIDGLKIRTAGDDGEIFAEMGAAVVFLPGGEVYESMQRGALDAYQLGGPDYDLSISMHEVTDYLYLSPVRQPATTMFYMVNEQAWAELPDDLKKLVEDEFLVASIKHWMETAKADIDSVSKWKDYGVEVSGIPADLELEMIRVSTEFYGGKAAADPFFAKVWESIQAVKDNYREAFVRL